VLDPQGRVLIVQEQKPDCYGKWNLPGGHVELAEPPPLGARRETREETGLDLPVRGLLGIYQGPVSLRFVFLADSTHQKPQPGDEILAVRFASPDEILAMADKQLQSPEMFRAILRDLCAAQTYPLDLFRPVD
jgi:8-oxo-dGTP pyrophosphatase MutT (NUDIX family)